MQFIDNSAGAYFLLDHCVLVHVQDGPKIALLLTVNNFSSK